MRIAIHHGATALACGLLIGITAGPAQAKSNARTINNNGLTCFNGYTYAQKSGAYRYTEHDEVRRVNGKITTWNVTYIGRQGQVLAKKHLDFSDNPTVPVYTLTMPDSGYREGIRHQNGQWTMFRQESADAKVETKPFSIDPPMAGDSGFNQLVQEHFAALLQGKTVHFKFVAAGRQSVLNLEASKTGTSTYNGRPAVVFTAKLDMFLVNLFVSSLKLTYDPQTERLLEYRGIGNIHNKKGKVYPVLVRYDIPMPAVAKTHGAPAPTCGSVKGSGP